MTILLAAIGALLLIPAAQAFAENQLTVNVAGSGSGEVSSVGGLSEFGGEFEGSPPVACSGPPKSGTCVVTMANQGGGEEEEFEEIGLVAVGLHATAGPGSEFLGWTVEDGNTVESFLEWGCSGSGQGNPKLGPGDECLMMAQGTGDAEVTATFCLVGQCPALTVVREGTGTGTVVSNPAGIECGATCTEKFAPNAKVTLTASPSAGSTFVSWKGCEKGGVNGRQCTVTMDAAKTVNAKFLTAYDVTVNRVGSGLGKVSSSPGGVLCLSNCASTTAFFKEGTSVTLSAAPSKNYVFTEWTGDCSGSSPTCSLGSLGADKTVGAKFTAVPQYVLSVGKLDGAGGGNGTVKSNLAGINCGATCSSMDAAYYQGQEVELTATPGKGSTVGYWGGSCSGRPLGTTTCKVTMNSAVDVGVEFK